MYRRPGSSRLAKEDSPNWLEEEVKVPLVGKTPRSEIVIGEVSLEI